MLLTANLIKLTRPSGAQGLFIGKRKGTSGNGRGEKGNSGGGENQNIYMYEKFIIKLTTYN